MSNPNITDDDRSIRMTEIMTPDMANFGGNVHGGAIMRLMDRVAYACAVRYSKHYCVTLSFDQVHFNKPIKVGELVTFYACVNYTGNTSMEIGIKVVAENIVSGDSRHTNTSYATMVAVDDNHKPVAVPKLKLNTRCEKRRYENAKLRRELRKEYNEKHQQKKSKTQGSNP